MSNTHSWKEAASLIIVTKASISQKVGLNLAKNLIVSSRVLQSSEKQRQIIKATKNLAKIDYRILMVKRSGLSSFMASAYVFPGGHVELSDFSPKWWKVFENNGLSRKDVFNIQKRIEGKRPPIITSPITINDDINKINYLPSDVALRIAAIRETFEETGILLLTDLLADEANTSLLSELDENGYDLADWRGKIRDNASSFIDLCIYLKMVPDIWSLYEWSDWLTPISVGHKRFDTMFYICCLEKQPKVVLDNTEVTTLKWIAPMEMLEEHAEERVFLAPPQVYELSRIHNLSNFNHVKEFARKREVFGIERWMPVLATYSDGAISFLPGDDMYPKEPDIIGQKPLADYPQKLEEMRSKVVNLNRIELRGPICLSVCNTQLSCGHLKPITYSPISNTMQSML